MLKIRPLRSRDRSAALAHLERDVRGNLLLMDFVDQLGGAPPAGEAAPQLRAAWRAGQLVGVVALRPSVVLDALLEPEVLDAFLPQLRACSAALVRSPEDLVDRLWTHLAADGRRALLDRTEVGHCVVPADLRPEVTPRDARVREAQRADLEALVFAARASLREEGRPDPFLGDPHGFRSWVRARLARACVVESGGHVVCVGYPDVRRAQGWLLQGIYTWPEARRRGYAAAVVSQLCSVAFAGGAAHVQLAVIEGNRNAQRLYERLGFRPFARLRTILFE